MRIHIIAGVASIAVACAPPSPQPQPNEMEQVVEATREDPGIVVGNAGEFREGPITPAERGDIYDVDRRTPAEVVALYGQLLDQGRFADAYALWDADATQLSLDEFVALFDRFETIDAAVGRMGPNRRAGDAVTDEVQLTLTGRTEAGSNYSLTGPVTVRRASSAEGAVDQRKWRIVAMTLTSNPLVAEEIVDQ